MCKNSEATSKFWALEGRYDASSKLRATQYKIQPPDRPCRRSLCIPASYYSGSQNGH